MKHFVLLAALALFGLAAPAYAAPEIGKPAPDFSAIDTEGQAFKLSDQKGKIVVLEWTNHDCPFVRKHYSVGNMQKLQKEAADTGVVWVSIVSSAPGKEGNIDAEKAKALKLEQKAAYSLKLLDSSGEIGKLYQAQTTPHLFIVDKSGALVYAGAIDNNPSPSSDVIATSTNYVKDALDDLAAGKPVTTASTQPYGCSVKY